MYVLRPTGIATYVPADAIPIVVASFPCALAAVLAHIPHADDRIAVVVFTALSIRWLIRAVLDILAVPVCVNFPVIDIAAYLGAFPVEVLVSASGVVAVAVFSTFRQTRESTSPFLGHVVNVTNTARAHGIGAAGRADLLPGTNMDLQLLVKDALPGWTADLRTSLLAVELAGTGPALLLADGPTVAGATAL